MPTPTRRPGLTPSEPAGASPLNPTTTFRRTLGALILLILLELVIAQSLNMFPHVIAIDFYQYWAVGAAPRVSDRPLGTPYADRRQYGEVIRDYAARTSQTRLTLNGTVLSPTGFTATPFLYMLFALFPADYGRALVVFHVLQIVLFVGAVVLLGVTYRYELFPLLCLALVLVLGSGPLSSDLRLGNLGCFQLAALAVLLFLTIRLETSPRAPVLGATVLAGLTLLVLAKPNVALVALAIGIHLLVARGFRFLALAAIPASIAAAAAAVIPCLYFHSWGIWGEWYHSVFGVNPYALARPAGGGNYSSPVLISRSLGTNLWVTAAVIAAILGATLIRAVLAPARGSRVATGLRSALELTFGAAPLAAAIGVTATIALPQLVWYHYYLVALIPGLWLLNAGDQNLALCGGAAVALSSGLLNVLFLPFGWTAAAGVGAALSWVPLWAGILLRLRAIGLSRTAASETPAKAATAPAPDQSADAGASPPRTRRSKRASGA